MPVGGLERCVDDVVSVLDAAEIESATVFVAASATPLGHRLAAAYPDRVSSLIIYNGYARFLSAPDQPFGLPAESLAGFKEMVSDNWGAESIILLAGPGTTWSPEVLRAAAANLRFTAAPATAQMLLPLLYESDERALLAATTVPATVLHAQHSPLVSIEHGRQLAAMLPNAEYRELPGHDHYFWGEDAQLIGDVIQRQLVGVRGEVDVDRVLTTVLFVDVVDSTGCAATLGDRAWRRFLDDFEATTRRALRHFSGREIKAIGDGFLACFDSPTKAVRCGLALRDAAQALAVELRVGVHTGEVELRGDDVGGIGVHIAARVQAAARPSEVLVSRTVADVVTGSGIPFSPRGEHLLKGVPGTWTLFAADRVADLPDVITLHEPEGRDAAPRVRLAAGDTGLSA